jgi:hypothetical protein
VQQLDENDADISSCRFVASNVTVAENGRYVSLALGPSSQQSTYHASWLWSNDPQRVLLPSGQRTATPGHWSSVHGRPRIQDAHIIYVDIGDKSTSDGTDEPTIGSEVVQVPGQTPKDCCHPLAIYGKYPPWISATTIPRDARENSANARQYLQITWDTTDTSNMEDGYTTVSIYDMEWLRRFQYNDESRYQHREKTEVKPMHAIRRDGPPLRYSTTSDSTNHPMEHGEDGLIHVDYQTIIDTDGHILADGLFTLLNAVFCDGAAIVSCTPQPTSPKPAAGDIEQLSEDDLPVAKVAKAMAGGELSHGALYGSIFHVRVGERNSNNVAYTSAPLCPHQDLAYYESPPGMQLLHCVAMGSGVEGGESTLIDAMAAAYRLREMRPDSFECLVKCPVTFVKQRDGACMTYRRPHIVLADDGDCSKSSSMDGEIIAVHWSPPFEGPVSLPPNDVDKYYEAYAHFERMLDVSLGDGSDVLSQYANEYTWERKLSPGDMLVFNNRRMLHGRTGFSAAASVSFEDSQRHLVGCYTNIDDTLNQYRVLMRERELHSTDSGVTTSILNVGNGTNIIP